MEDLTIHERPKAHNPPMILGFTGWMDGGGVSTGTVRYLRRNLKAKRFAEINPLDFYIFNFPVSTIPVSVFAEEARAVVAAINPMEFAAVFRPHTHIEDGVIRRIWYPRNRFFYSESANVVLFSGEEPHIRWGTYCECVFRVAEELGVKEFYFVGSVASPIPHTREPRIRASVSGESLKAGLEELGIGFGEYQGPSSLVTSLAHQSMDRGIAMRSLVVEVPHYPFLDMPTYPRSIMKTTSTLTSLLGIDLKLSDLSESADVADVRLNSLMGENAEFKKLVKKLEEAYDIEQSGTDEELLRRLIEGIDLEADDSRN
jgi:proteasome assembly chaperone (PAC2) family protein